ncbi:MAG: DUF6120 family protein [Acutalibacteraceae bacterium]
MMTKTNDLELKEYYAQISNSVVCGRKQKNAFLKELKSSVEEFRLSNPQASVDDIKAFFGSPEQIAASFTENSDGTKLERTLSVKKLLLLAVILALLIYVAFIVISLIDVHYEAHGYFSEGILTVVNALKGVTAV